ncbi:MAG TPA: hypothetical protein VGQ95_04580 [Chthoniobacterales bacterium]|nr:hypothetical protein [Chthoniobacterales bacterium]
MTSDEEAEADLNDGKKLKELLKEIYRLARGMTTPGQRDLHTMSAIGKFSAILIRISDRAEKQSQRIISLTWALIIFTVVLLLFAAVETIQHFCTL